MRSTVNSGNAMKEKKDFLLHYNYVYFNANYNRSWNLDPNEYNAICLRDAENMKDVKVLQVPLQDYPSFFRIFYRFYNSSRVQTFLRLPRKLFFPFIFKNTFKNNKPFCFVFASTSYPLEYIEYLRSHYPGCKIVKIHRDLVKIAHLNPNYSEENMNRIFDLRFTFDPGEAKNYNMVHFNEIESKVPIVIAPDYPLCDVFFAGMAKDRLPKLIEAYDKFTTFGLKCSFFITHVKKEDQIQRVGITYSDRFMPYMEMLYKSVNARFMFDINQSGAVGYTSRFLEAVMYNKRFITDNISVKDTKYYTTGNIFYYEKIEDIRKDFFDNSKADYGYKGEFSPINLILQIDKELSK